MIEHPLVAAVRAAVRPLSRRPLWVAVSGGPDSTATLVALSEVWPLELLRVVHINHALRGIESEEDALFCRTLGERFNLPCELIRCPISPGTHLQERARAARLAALERVKSRDDWVAFGHTADDQLETILLRLSRGSSPQGVFGMAVIHEWAIRPLLRVYKRDVLDFLRAREVLFRTDSSNEKTDYLRNFIRHEVLEPIERKRPGTQKAWLRYFEILNRESGLLNDLCEQWVSTHWVAGAKDRTLDFRDPTPVVVACFGRVLQSALRSIGWSECRISMRRIEQIERALSENQGPKVFSLGRRRLVRSSGKRLSFLEMPDKS